jgi:hypothetical protein
VQWLKKEAVHEKQTRRVRISNVSKRNAMLAAGKDYTLPNLV